MVDEGQRVEIRMFAGNDVRELLGVPAFQRVEEIGESDLPFAQKDVIYARIIHHLIGQYGRVRAADRGDYLRIDSADQFQAFH